MVSRRTPVSSVKSIQSASSVLNLGDVLKMTGGFLKLIIIII